MLKTRDQVGFVAQILQRQDLLFHRITLAMPGLIVVREGAKEFAGPTGRLSIPAGGAIALAGGQVCDVTNHVGRSGAYRATALGFAEDLLLPIANPRPAARLTRLPPDLTEAIDAAVRAVAEPDSVPLSVARHRMQEVLLWLADQGIGFAPTPRQSIGARLMHMIAQDPGRDWTVPHVASLFAVSETTLRRRLTDEGLGLRSLVTETRMTAALTLLQTSDAAVGQIAYDLGYDSASRFTARFRERFGFVPTDIRNKARDHAAP